MITPNNLDDDYDWELYDITGHNPNEVFTDGNLSIACNWSGETGLTGTSSSASETFVCAGYGKPLNSKQPVLKVNHNYLLLVSHFAPFTNSMEGYTLEFNGGSAVITDTRTPALMSAGSNCGGDIIRVKLNKKMLCNSIAPDGTDFYIDGNPVTFSSATGIGCSSRFDTDSIEIKIGQQLPPGDYVLKVKEGTDENTILDICGTALPTTETMAFTIQPIVPTPMDSLVPVSCAPRELKLIFPKDILCSSIAEDGTDFSIIGPYPVGIVTASGNCADERTKEITITLDKAISQKGDFRIQLKRGSDGNTLLDECNEETPPGSSLPFSVKDTVNADFSYNITYGCVQDLVAYSHPGNNEVSSFIWDLDDNMASTQQNPEARYSRFTEKQVQLIVSNGFCADTAKQTVVLDNFIQADFSVAEDNCPLEPIQLTSTAVGNIVSHHWNFGDGNTSNEVSPNHIFNRTAATREYRIQYTVTNAIGCSSSIEKTTKVYVSCLIDVPNAFTPNSDGRNDMLYPLNAVKAEQLTFTVYNRWGQVVFSTTNWKKGWDGRFNSELQASGVYIWTLTFTDRDSKKQFSKKGKTTLIR
ncbi:PKD domain-containing protein [Flavihumibacter fluvii]|uniref:PKD domain-containing protein n=1 Tax=Flavihumibacter fluvii TaxID=2838157 RepID=UPI001BDE61E0|nr:PKD domain-containing protein [Flavihumibacter fluvii]ULQ53434.1 gliding motility-associated C-terminal domain-containing protein [Flavihumibacter fluvii]